MKYVRKRDGKLAEFNADKITEAVWKATKAVGGKNRATAEEVSRDVVATLIQKYGDDGVPTVEEIQDIVEKTLIKKGYDKVAKAYILYRRQHQEMRELALLLGQVELVESYIDMEDWRVKENANMTYSLQGLNNYLAGTVVANYWLNKLYPPEIAEAHKNGDIHIHNLSMLAAYCVGWDMFDLLTTGFKGAQGKIASKPAKHFRTALGQIVNYIYTLQNETAGAQAFSYIDVYLAPFIRSDNLNQHAVDQAVQEFIFNMNVPTRVGGQTPFSNITLGLHVPKFMQNMPAIIAGELQNTTYGDYEKEVAMFNKAFMKVMTSGDAEGRVFTFPIPTYNVTPEFDWDSETAKELWEMTAKYGIPYFANFINSDMKPEDVRSMCCRLRLDTRELRKKGGGLFGADPLTGSIGVVTINLPRIGYIARDERKFYEQLDKMLEIAKESLEIKRKTLERFTEKQLYPYCRFYLRNIKERHGGYWKNHFSTIGIIGMNEALLNMIGASIIKPEGQKLAIQILEHIREKITKFQEETGNLYNLEATPAEGTSYRLAKIDKKKYPQIITANEKQAHATPFYTGSTLPPADANIDLFDALENQEPLQTKYTGGTVFHIYLGERLHNGETAKQLIKKILSAFKLPYITLTPTFSICQSHGYINGNTPTCPYCGSKCEVYSRVVGYLRPVDQWNEGKQAEFRMRKTYEQTIIAT
ncbi:MAG: ribonucleoside triphosphate reductase [Candidatus Bathyarchaeota archaeon]|nr:ribonucleoside triphosphate reductase [Candidatus Bathyarchaeota archaeon]